MTSLGNTLVEKLGNSLLVALVGMTVVFLGLCILIGLIKLLAKATEQMGKKKETPAPAPVAPAVETPAVEEAPQTDDAAVVAAITAAIACMMEDGSAFTVRRVRRISAAPAWQKAGREEQIYSHF